ncbi:hypothetical protein BGX38DRAFT_1232623, partial [Terfezia claveryi]
MATPAVVIPDGLSNVDPELWKRLDVLVYLEANKGQYELDNENINNIHKNKVSGLVFLQLTREKLLQIPYVLSDGAAVTILHLRDKVTSKRPRGIFEYPPTVPSPVPDSTTFPSWAPSSPLVTYKVKSSSMSTPGNQTRDYLTPLLESELEGTIYREFQGFDKLFETVVLQMHSVMASTTVVDWLMSAKGTDNILFENLGIEWFGKFSQQITDLGLNVAGRWYYGSSDTRLKDAYHGAQCKLDICLSRKLDTPHAKSNHSWKDVLVLEEFKSNSKMDLGKSLILQLARYVREAFGAQPGRRFMHAFTMYGERARFWMFDRVGISISVFYNISTEPGQNFFIHGLLCYMVMTASQLGFDERYKDTLGEVFLPSMGGSANPAYLHLGNKKFQLMRILSWSPAIVTRATLCWLAKDCDSWGTWGSGICTDTNCSTCKECAGKICVVKEAWRDNKLSCESNLWHLDKQKGVFGSLDIIVACDADVVSRDGEEENNVRQWFDYSEAIPIEGNGGIEETKSSAPTPQKSKSCRKSAVDTVLITIYSDDEDGEGRPKSICRTKDRTRPSKARKVKDYDVLQARTRSFMVVRNMGVGLNCNVQPLQLAEILCDTIKNHRSLYEKAGILHCDVSINNIMRTRINDSSGLKGFLIDLDYAHQLKPDFSPEQLPCRTGTAPFMALELLLQESPVYRTWRHDLESFFYVLVWLCIQNPYRNLASWVKGLRAPEFVDKKKADVTVFFEEWVLDNLRKRDILFYGHIDVKTLEGLTALGLSKEIKGRLGTPVSEAARCGTYDKIIQAFDACIASLQLKSQEEDDRQREVE